jgi:transcriptional regulator with XRE-family HTH domain
MKTKNKAKDVDRIIGSNIKVARALSGLTQQQLAENIGISFQQIQKYEKGTNRVSASTLLKIAEIMEVAPESFFAGTAGADQKTPAQSYTMNREVLDLLALYNQIEDDQVRTSIRDFLRTFSSKRKNEKDRRLS